MEEDKEEPADGCKDDSALFTVDHDDPLSKGFLWLGVLLLVLVSGFFAGLGLGFMGLDKIGLEIVASAGDPDSARCAKIIAPMRKDGNLLLVSLLTGNVAVNVLISILLSDLTSGLYGFIFSTLLIVVFGDIVPQAICSRHALQIGARAVPVVRLIELVLYPFAKPMASVLDLVLGDELGTIHTRQELLKLLQIHVKHGSVDAEAGNILTGALSYSDIKVSEIMTPIDQVFSLPLDGQLDYRTVSTIFKAGLSRIPIYGSSREDILGLLITKDLILIDPGDCTSIKNFMALFGRRVTFVWHDTPLHEVLNMFKAGKGHMAMVKDVVNQDGPGDPYYVVRGIVTLEDVIRYILGGGIADEPDSYTDLVDHVVDRGLFNTSRLRLLDRTLLDERLATSEIKAVAGFLLANVASFRKLQGLDLADKLAVVLSNSPVVTLGQSNKNNSNGSRSRQGSTATLLANSNAAAAAESKKAEGGDRKDEAGNAIYRKGRGATFCTVILNGKLSVACGGDDFMCDAGPWTVLAAEALFVENGQYIADFTATVPSEEEVRCVQIDGSSFRQVVFPPPPLSPLVSPTGQGAMASSEKEGKRRETPRSGAASVLLMEHKEPEQETELRSPPHKTSGEGSSALPIGLHMPQPARRSTSGSGVEMLDRMQSQLEPQPRRALSGSGVAMLFDRMDLLKALTAKEEDQGGSSGGGAAEHTSSSHNSSNNTTGRQSPHTGISQVPINQ